LRVFMHACVGLTNMVAGTSWSCTGAQRKHGGRPYVIIYTSVTTVYNMFCSAQAYIYIYMYIHAFGLGICMWMGQPQIHNALVSDANPWQRQETKPWQMSDKDCSLPPHKYKNP
jgi:hypothetical protein